MVNDTIRRQAAIDALNGICDRECEYSKKQRAVMCASCHLGSAFDAIDDLPSAERLGRWEMKEDPYGFFDTIPVCSACGCTPKSRVTSAYCPSCGAKMEGEQNG